MKQAVCLGWFTVAGWKVARMLLPAGRKYGVIIGADKPREALGASAIWVRGRAEGVNHTTGEKIVRVPGTFRGHEEVVPGGRYTVEAIEDTEWWCVDTNLNGGVRPTVSPVQFVGVLPDSPEGATLLVCTPDGLAAPAPTPTFGLLFSSARL